MTITDINDRLNSVYNDLDELTQIPLSTRNEIETMLEDIMSKMDACIDEYGDEPIEDENGDEDENF